MEKEKIIQTIRSNEALLKGSGIRRLALFGSYSRQSATHESDIDFIWELDSPRTLSSMAKAQKCLESLFPNQKIDTVFEKAIHQAFREKIKEDLVEIFPRK